MVFWSKTDLEFKPKFEYEFESESKIEYNLHSNTNKTELRDKKLKIELIIDWNSNKMFCEFFLRLFNIKRIKK